MKVKNLKSRRENAYVEVQIRSSWIRADDGIFNGDGFFFSGSDQTVFVLFMLNIFSLVDSNSLHLPSNNISPMLVVVMPVSQ